MIRSLRPISIRSRSIRVTSLLIPGRPNNTSIRAISREDLFKTALGQLAVGVDVPLTRRTELNALYLWRNYAEGWSLRRFRSQNQIYVVQDGVDVSDSLGLDPVLFGQDTLLVDSEDPLKFYGDLSFFSHAHVECVLALPEDQPHSRPLDQPIGPRLGLGLSLSDADGGRFTDRANPTPMESPATSSSALSAACGSMNT